jgi:hypothetical protein
MRDVIKTGLQAWRELAWSTEALNHTGVKNARPRPCTLFSFVAQGFLDRRADFERSAP